MAEALVLTEWKLVRRNADLGSATAQARMQADRYTRGALGGIELTRYRYLVMVSLDFLPRRDDVESGGTVYRLINIAVKPIVPSAGVVT